MAKACELLIAGKYPCSKSGEHSLCVTKIFFNPKTLETGPAQSELFAGGLGK